MKLNNNKIFDNENVIIFKFATILKSRVSRKPNIKEFIDYVRIYSYLN